MSGRFSAERPISAPIVHQDKWAAGPPLPLHFPELQRSHRIDIHLDAQRFNKLLSAKDALCEALSDKTNNTLHCEQL